MTARRTVVRRAPGKLFLVGEYAVVEPGTPSILMAVDRDVVVTVSHSETADTVIASDLGPRRRSPHVAAAIEIVGRLLAEHGLRIPALRVAVSSRLHEDGRKFGLGSSGAVTVATVAAVAEFCGLLLSHDHLFRLSLLATAQIDARGSGGDVAASTWGGWIAYRAPDRARVLELARRQGVRAALLAPWTGLEVRRLPPPRGLTLEVGWTGRPASTASLASTPHHRTWRHSASHGRFVETSTDVVHAAIDALTTGDGPGLLRQVRRARRALAQLDQEAGLGIFTTELTALCEVAESVGGAAKPSGAGGGDCGLALLDARAHPDIAHLRERWTAAGVRPLPIRPATERNEERPV
ncbi:phosphomevalonate kinase [Streptomyces mutabilis]|uniref:phosphomevalonate kinase n=1 Tax=Streptomyces mutabilis TaxID=67332 RepID=UPI00177F94B2|nr:phosphomevalonate kinase [Streptomyces mutabilis]GGQ49486.1 phosphomevalonate kinase [Streptomyces mutabilis]